MILVSVKRMGILKPQRDNPLLMFDEEAQRVLVRTTIQQIVANTISFIVNISSDERMNFIFDSIAVGFKLPIVSDVDFQRVENCLNIYQRWMDKENMPSHLKQKEESVVTMLTHISLLFGKENKINSPLSKYIPLCQKALILFEKGIVSYNSPLQKAHISTLNVLLIGIMDELIGNNLPNSFLKNKENVVKCFELICKTFVITGTQVPEWKIFTEKIMTWLLYPDVFDKFEAFLNSLQNDIFLYKSVEKEGTVIVLFNYMTSIDFEIQFLQLKEVWKRMFNLLDPTLVINQRILPHYVLTISNLARNISDISLRLTKTEPSPQTMFTLYYSKLVYILLNENMKDNEETVLFIIPSFAVFLENLNDEEIGDKQLALFVVVLKRLLKSNNMNIVTALFNELPSILSQHTNFLSLILEPLIRAIFEYLNDKTRAANIVIPLIYNCNYYISLSQNKYLKNAMFEKDFIERATVLILYKLLFVNFEQSEVVYLFEVFEHFFMEFLPSNTPSENDADRIENIQNINVEPKTTRELLWKFLVTMKMTYLTKLVTMNNEKALLCISRIFKFTASCINDIPNTTEYCKYVVKTFLEFSCKFLNFPTMNVFNNVIHLVIIFTSLNSKISDELFFEVNNKFITLEKAKSTFYSAPVDQLYTFFISHFFNSKTKFRNQNVFDLFLKKRCEGEKQNMVSVKNNGALYIFYEKGNLCHNENYVLGITWFGKTIYRCTPFNRGIHTSISGEVEEQTCGIHTAQHVESSQSIISFANKHNFSREQSKMLQIVKVLKAHNYSTESGSGSPSESPPNERIKRPVTTLMIGTLFPTSFATDAEIDVNDVVQKTFTLFVTPLMPLSSSFLLPTTLYNYLSSPIENVKTQEKHIDILVTANERIIADSSFKISQLKFNMFCFSYFNTHYIFRADIAHVVLAIRISEALLSNPKRILFKLNKPLSMVQAHSTPLTTLFTNTKTKNAHSKKTSVMITMESMDDPDWLGPLNQNFVMRRQGSTPLKVCLEQHIRRRSNSAPTDD
ncbi:hypothetical protein EIN_403640 [Entamoeba invadens IP1]|uniref:Rap-GAP domain-containing protein n=1 Tax=Entamoeba invadens IP1 TaxID=370355 RepID=A0A0A1U6S8_ENTIV|nr:hypothetical protein EIN_403640 [Entamoeba invadens IP1]ELP90030.1 hypothetical protein EIN_403640 [Entamoeba invadens IP1]|eukprot:XP_004256801.1 hypothetical protein EIN_403640 [Entamoeba invadens IP1]